MAASPGSARKRRPVYLDLLRIRQPLPAIVSILHRISGAGLALVGIPLLLWGVQSSLGSPEAFAQLKSCFAMPLSKLVVLGLVWAYLHHFFAGLRYLMLDLHIGDELPQARATSVAVLVVSLALTLVVGIRLW